MKSYCILLILSQLKNEVNFIIHMVWEFFRNNEIFQVTRDNCDLAGEYLTDVVSNQEFKPWELGDNFARLKLEVDNKAPGTEAMELLHSAAFRYFKSYIYIWNN